jgi:tetratricopeptide (TPR) repeat protein
MLGSCWRGLWRSGLWRSTVCALLVWSASVPLAGTAAAQSAESQAAEALFRQARALLDKGEFEPACEKFAASQALEPGLGTLLYLGDCYERAGRFASALATFREAAELADERDDATRLRLAQVRVSALAPRAPTLEIRNGPAPQALDLQISVGGAPLPAADIGRAVPRDAGRYEIRFSAPGYESFVSRIDLKNADAVLVTVPRLVPIPNPGRGVAPGPAESEALDTGRTLAWVVGGTGAALAITATVFAVLAAGKNSDSKSKCDPDAANRCGPDGVALRNDAKDLANLATVFSVLGGVGLAGGVVLYVSAPATEGPIGQAALIGLRGSIF